MSECPYCSRKPGEKDMHPIETHPLDRDCMHFYENLYPPPMTLVMREMAVPHALPMVFGDLSYEAPVGGEGRRAHCLALGLDDDYVYFGVVPTESGELPGKTVRVCREHAAELGSILVSECRSKELCQGFERHILRILERVRDDPDTDLEACAREIYHGVTDAD